MADRPKVQIVRTDDGVSFYLNGRCLDETTPDRNPCYAAESIAKELARALGADVEAADEPDARPYVYRLAWHAGGRYGSCWHTRSTPIEDEVGEADARASVARSAGITAPIVFLSIEYIDGPC